MPFERLSDMFLLLDSLHQVLGTKQISQFGLNFYIQDFQGI